MDIFDIHDQVVDRYQQYVRSFLAIADDDIRGFIERAIFEEHALWPDALVQLNPAYERTTSVEDMVRNVSIIMRHESQITTVESSCRPAIPTTGNCVPVAASAPIASFVGVLSLNASSGDQGRGGSDGSAVRMG